MSEVKNNTSENENSEPNYRAGAPPSIRRNHKTGPEVSPSGNVHIPPTDATPPVVSNEEGCLKPDPFDLAAVKRKAATSVAVKKTLVVRVTKKIDKTTWFQTCPTDEMHTEGYLLDPGDAADGLFWVSPHRLEEIDDSTIRLYELHLCISKKGNSLFFWAIGLPNEDGRDVECNTIRREYARERGQWMRLEWNDASRMHDQTISLANWPDPDWPSGPIEDLIRVAFRGRVIETPDHPVVQQLKGLK